mgnify:CR=1 FL=1
MGERKGREMTPEQEAILAERPEHDDATEIAVMAFHDLETCRPIGLVAGLIPWTAIDRWCERHGLDDLAALVLIEAVTYADREDFKERTRKQSTPTSRNRARMFERPA